MYDDNHRTYHLIRPTFVELWSNTPYGKLSVTDIAEKSGVSRQTFYLHHSSKEELALSFLDDIFDIFFTAVEPIADKNNSQLILQALFETYRDNIDKWDVVSRCNIGESVRKRYRRYVSRLMGSIIRRSQADFSDSFYIDCLVSHLAASSYDLAKLWIDSGMIKTAEEMGRINWLLIHCQLPELVLELESLSQEIDKTVYEL